MDKSAEGISVIQKTKMRHNSEVIWQLKKQDAEGPAAMHRWSDMEKPRVTYQGKNDLKQNAEGISVTRKVKTKTQMEKARCRMDS